MIFPNLKEEKRLWKKGYKYVVGIDEVGRGPLAGPVMACAVIINPGFKLKGVSDSKKLTPQKREEIYDILIHSDIIYGIGKVSERMIDKINIFNATKLAMKRAIAKLEKIDYLLLDGNFKIDSDISQKSIIKGDEKVMSCALASIIAKVERDKLMLKYHKKYPNYGFDRHKGYGTKYHYEMLQKFGPSVIHRRSFNISGKIF